MALLSLLIGGLMAARPSKLVIVSWDAGADWVLDRLVAEGKLPNVARMKALGANADYVIPTYPSKTAVSHFAIFSGTWPNKSGVSGNSSPLLPRSEHYIDESQSGFNANQHQTEPLWVAIAKQGKKVLALSAAGSAPPEADVARLIRSGGKKENYIEFSGFESGFFSPKVFDFSTLEGSADTKSIKISDTTIEAISGPTGLSLKGIDANGKALKRMATVKADEWVGPFQVKGRGMVGLEYFRLFSWDPKTGRSILYARAVAGMKGTQNAQENYDYLKAYGGFHDDPFGPYQAGALGKPIYEGGDGSAESRVVEAVKFDMELVKHSFRYGWKKYQPDLVFQYTPQSDNAGHCWMGLLDPASPLYKTEIANKILPYYEKVFILQDAWLGDMMKVAGKGTGFALVSDHGMAGITKRVSVNRILLDAGLLFLDETGRIDYTKTKVCCPGWSDFAIVVNGTDRKGGIVSPAERDEVIAKTRKALGEAKDPETGKLLVTQILTAEEAFELGGGGEAGGDLYLDFPDGYYPSSRANEPVVTMIRGNRGEGVHGFIPTRRTMHSIFYALGPGIQNHALPVMRVIDIAPTLCRWMGWAPPADATGKAIDLSAKP